jgi:esterase/lipase
MINANINRTIISFKQAISDLKILINYIKSFSNSEVFVAGLSLGGIVSNLITAFEKNIDGIISLFYPNSMAYLTYNHPIEMLILNELKNNNIDEKKLANYWNAITPSNYKPLVSREKFLFVSGKYDLIAPLADSDVLWKAWNIPNRIVLNCGHSGTVLLRKQVQKHVKIFLERI